MAFGPYEKRVVGMRGGENGGCPRFCQPAPATQGRQFERIVAGTVYVGWAKGGTRAFMSAARMHASTGLPAAHSVMETLATLPSD